MIFTITMWGGLFFALILAFGPLLGMKTRPTELLILSMVHMVILTLIAWIKILRKKDDHTDTGIRLSTTGYVHTLIGTCAALISAASFKGDIHAIQEIINPIGSALGTSIIGWSMGKEMQRAVWSSEKEDIGYQDELENSFREFSAQIRRLSSRLEESGKEWEKGVTKLRESLELSGEEWKSGILYIRKNLEDSGGELKKGIDALKTDLERSGESWLAKADKTGKSLETSVNSIIDKINSAGEGVNVSAGAVRDLSETIHTALNDVDKKLKGIIQVMGNSALTMRQGTEETASAMNTVSSGVKNMGKEIYKINESLKDAAKIISEADKLLAQLRQDRG